jgi:hypothetical protein
MRCSPGKWERAILEVLTADRPAIWLRDLLPRQCSGSEYRALYRAAYRLSGTGQVCVWTRGRSHSPLIIAKPGYRISNRSEAPRAKGEGGLVRIALGQTSNTGGS